MKSIKLNLKVVIAIGAVEGPAFSLYRRDSSPAYNHSALTSTTN